LPPLAGRSDASTLGYPSALEAKNDVRATIERCWDRVSGLSAHAAWGHAAYRKWPKPWRPVGPVPWPGDS